MFGTGARHARRQSTKRHRLTHRADFHLNNIISQTITSMPINPTVSTSNLVFLELETQTGRPRRWRRHWKYPDNGLLRYIASSWWSARICVSQEPSKIEFSTHFQSERISGIHIHTHTHTCTSGLPWFSFICSTSWTGHPDYGSLSPAGCLDPPE